VAHAPTPGVSTRANAAAAAQRIVVVRLVRTDETFRLAANNVPLDQRAVVLKQVGVSFDAVMQSGDGMLMTAVTVFLSRRMNGEASLSWAQFQRQWPDDLTEADIDAWAEDTQGRRLNEDGLVPEVDAIERDEIPEATDPQS
jgi:hypothetical protein